MKILMNAELEKPYSDWRKVYNAHKSVRDEAGITEILCGWCEEDQRIHVCFEVESMEVMQSFMEQHQDIIKESGHKAETTVAKVITD